MQESIVYNKKQLMVALKVADMSPYPTRIIIGGTTCVYEVAPMVNLRKVRGKLRKTAAHIFKGVV